MSSLYGGFARWIVGNRRSRSTHPCPPLFDLDLSSIPRVPQSKFVASATVNPLPRKPPFCQGRIIQGLVGVPDRERLCVNFDEVLSESTRWRQRMIEVKAANPPADFTWYGYDILANAVHLDGLLKGQDRMIFDDIAGGTIADVGAADGDLGFMFAGLGYTVDIIDWPATNWNGLQGAKTLRTLLDSAATVHEVDLDTQFGLPRQAYDLVLLLGILYHLKNPYYTLEYLAKHTRYCLLSTRVTRRVRHDSTVIAGEPVAYLLDPDECNNDSTNFWIFTVSGLERLARRCGFVVRAVYTVGDVMDSNPQDPEHDERAFMLLESAVFDAR